MSALCKQVQVGTVFRRMTAAGVNDMPRMQQLAPRTQNAPIPARFEPKFIFMHGTCNGLIACVTLFRASKT